MLRGDGEAVSGPGQIKAQLSGCIVPDLNLTGGGCTVYKQQQQGKQIGAAGS